MSVGSTELTQERSRRLRRRWSGGHVSADIAHEAQSPIRDASAARSLRARIVLALGPLTVLGGVVWAVVQPWRLTILHPHGQGFWWLLSEPPLFVVLVGVAFRLVVARGLVEDLEARR